MFFDIYFFELIKKKKKANNAFNVILALYENKHAGAGHVIYIHT